LNPFFVAMMFWVGLDQSAPAKKTLIKGLIVNPENEGVGGKSYFKFRGFSVRQRARPPLPTKMTKM